MTNGSTKFPGFVQLEIYHGPSIVGTFVGSTSGGEEIIDRTGTLTPMWVNDWFRMMI